jgi:hypothetical protein
VELAKSFFKKNKRGDLMSDKIDPLAAAIAIAVAFEEKPKKKKKKTDVFDDDFDLEKSIEEHFDEDEKDKKDK